MLMQSQQSDVWHGTTILTVRKGGTVAIGGDGQVSIGQTIVKANARKVRRLTKGDVIGGVARAAAPPVSLVGRAPGEGERKYRPRVGGNTPRIPTPPQLPITP